MYPVRFEKMIEMFERLPGVGAKTAQRYAFSMLQSSKEDLDTFAETLQGLKEIHPCPTCGFLTDGNTCEYCSDQSRDKELIMVVAYPQDVIAIEKTGTYHGLYHVLNGLISASKGVYSDDIGVDALLKRIDGSVKEVIIATSPTMDGEMTALYLDKVLKNKEVLVTRLAHGLPMGASLDYADEMTLIKAMDNRRKMTE